jgi:molybdopterin synthase sulfur carrier subunit
MVQITFTSNLQKHVPCARLEVAGGTVREVLERVFDENPRLRSYLLDDQQRLRKHVNVYIDDRPVTDRLRLADPVAPDSRLYVFQMLTGG